MSDSVWILLNSMNILLMQAGFALLEAGTVDKKHGKSVLMKNLMDGCVGCVVWYMFGYGLYTGSSTFASGSGAKFFLNDEADFDAFFVSFAFAITAATIVSGAVVARMQLFVYLILSCFLTGIIYPIIAHWVWNPNGFLYTRGYVDYAGGTCVHGLGGVIAIIGAWYCGPRLEKFDNSISDGKHHGLNYYKGVADSPPSNASSQCLGTLILYVGWFSFNGVSAGSDYSVASRSSVNTLLASSTAACTGLLYCRFRTGLFDISKCLNCLLAGLVGITQNAGYVDTWAAFLIGILSCFIFLGAEFFILYIMRIDDPLSASALHGVTGFCGTLWYGLFNRSNGLFTTGQISNFVVQVWGSLLILGFAALCAIIILQVCYKVLGNTVSVADEDQILGLDFKYHDGHVMEELGPRQIKEFTDKKIALQKIQARKSASQKVTPDSERYTGRGTGRATDRVTGRPETDREAQHSYRSAKDTGRE